MINKSSFIGLIICFYGLFLLPVNGQFSITGTWELVYVAPTYMDDTDPRGITNIRLHFKPDGKLFNIWPNEVLSDSTESVNYNFQGSTLTINPEGKEPYIINVAFTDSNTMIFTSEYSSKRIFKRMPEPDAINNKIEPKSLQLVNTGQLSKDSEKEILYDIADYSFKPLRERINGVWEVTEYQNVPTHEMPPYGFLNDIWIIKNKELEILQRTSQDTSSHNYKLTLNDEIILTAPDGSILLWKISFNKWGQMILDSGNGSVIFRLVTKDSQKILAVPLKVVLLKLAGED